MTELSYEQLDAEEKALLDAAEEGLKNSYNPYNSQMLVAAAVRARTGEIIVGSNFANDSSPSNLCAERAAILTANSRGSRALTMMAIIGKKFDRAVINPVTPCGECRQVMFETAKIAGTDIPVLCSNSEKTKIFKTSVNELLPLPYAGVPATNSEALDKAGG
jgi:cytidine deaminase